MKVRTLVLFPIAMFLCLLFVPIPQLTAQASSIRLTTDQPFYSIWRVGGTVTISASGLASNQTYYLWLQRPSDSAFRNLGIQFKGSNGTVTNQLTIAASDLPGTYAASLSKSSSSNTREAVAHFGVFGTNSNSYARTQQIQVSGGGYLPNSTVTITMITAGETVPGSPSEVKVGLKGDLSYEFKLPPSLRTGVLIISATGRVFDQNMTIPVSTQVNVGPTSVNFRLFAQVSSEIERTAQASISYQLTYPDGSPVTTATTNSTRVIVVDDANRKTVGETRLLLTDNTNGVWKAVWVSSPSANLSAYHFEFSPADFDDSYGNLGKGSVVSSGDFNLIRADMPLTFQANSTLQRTTDTDIVIAAKYYDGASLGNNTQLTGTLTQADGKTLSAPLIYNNTLKEFRVHLKVPVDASLGTWRLVANIKDAYGNIASGTFTFQIIKAGLRFGVDLATSAERTTILNVTAKITYPDGSEMTQGEIPRGFNVTLTKGNFTWNQLMSFDGTTGSWFAAYQIPQNATLGQYSISIQVQDAYGNAGDFATPTQIVPARFRFGIPKPVSKADPLTIVEIPVHVTYPNGSALIPKVGGVVTATVTNSTGAFTFPMNYNSTDQSWHLFYYTPNLGLSFGATIVFSFNAQDQFGNTGSASKAYELDVGAGTQTLILATILGAIVPMALVGWAIVTITTRKRKHKP